MTTLDLTDEQFACLMPRTAAMLARVDARKLLRSLAEDCHDSGDDDIAVGIEQILVAVERLMAAANAAYPEHDYSEDMHGFEIRMALIQIGAELGAHHDNA